MKKKCDEYMVTMQKQIDSIKEEMKKKVDEDRVKEIVKEELKAPHSNDGSKAVTDIVDEKLTERESELKERELRKNNVICFNLPEAATDLKDARIKFDTEDFMKLCSDKVQVNVEKDDIVKIIRLGKKKENKEPRPLQVTLKDSDLKQELFQNLGNLAESQKEENDINLTEDQNDEVGNKDEEQSVKVNEKKPITIVHDLTQRQREEHKTLMQEARNKTLNEKSGKYVYRVRGPPWNWHIKRMAKKPTQ